MTLLLSVNRQCLMTKSGELLYKNLTSQKIIGSALFILHLSMYVEGNSVKALNQCKLENMKKLIEPPLFLELSNIRDKCHHLSLCWFVGRW